MTPLQLIREVYKELKGQATSGLTSISIPRMRLKEDEEPKTDPALTKQEEEPATYNGAYLLISTRYDVPKEVVQTYGKRWRIEVFIRTAKQELAFEKCHSESEAHHHAHFELLFTTETLLAIALFELNKKNE